MQKPNKMQLALAACLLMTCLRVTAEGTSSDPVRSYPVDDRALTNLVRDSLENSPRVQEASAALAAAQARERGADRSLYNPELELDAEKADIQTTSIGISQTIDWSDKQRIRTMVATAERETAAANLAEVRQVLTADLLSSLITYHNRQALSRLARKRAELTRRLLALAIKRRQAGDLPQVELNMAQLAASEARMQQARAVYAQAEALQDLIVLTGDARPDWPSLSDDMPPLDPRQFDADRLLNQLPSLRAQQTRVNAARASIELRRRERRPDPTVALRGGREDSDALIGFSVSIPLFVRNDFQTEVSAAREDSIAAERRLQDMARVARARLLSTAERYRMTREAWQEWRHAGNTSLQHQSDLLQRLWQAGELGTTDYLLQLTQSLDTHVSAQELRGNLWQGWVDYLAASGQLEAWLGLEAPLSSDTR
jgi:cobalt-zinc-cadmium efflux system outer membrane protein